MSASVTCMPALTNALAIPNPMPLPPPVMNATLPSTSSIVPRFLAPGARESRAISECYRQLGFEVRRRESVQTVARRDPLPEGRLGQRGAQEVPLRRRAAEGGERVPALARLDSLGDDVEIQALRELDDRADDGGCVPLRRQLADDGAIDLDLGDRQARQLGERGMAGSEVVDDDADAAVGKPPEDVLRARGVAERRRLGDLELEPCGIRADLPQQRIHLVGEGGVEKVSLRQVDGDGQR